MQSAAEFGWRQDQFDIRHFHNVVLTNGAMPPTILERLVDLWIEDQVTVA